MATPKKKLTARLAVVRTHTVTIGAPPNEVKLEGMVQTGEWEDYQKLENENGDWLIIDVTDDFNGIQIGHIAKGSEALLEQIANPPKAPEPAPAQGDDAPE